jgi:hypothetical protein
MIIFTFNPHSIIDIITNSSSELFVFKSKSKEIIEEMIEEVYPNYLKEYMPLIHINDLEVEDLNNYLTYHCSAHQWPARPGDMPLIGDYTFDELYEPEINMRTGEIEVAWNGEIQYTLRDNSRPPKKENKIVKNFDDFKDVDPFGEEKWDNEEDELPYWDRSFVTDKNIEEVKNRIDPNRKMYFLYSIGDNPNWDYQIKLMEIGYRYHLG